MNFMKRNILVLFVSLCSFLMVKASVPGFEIVVDKTWTGETITYTQAVGEIKNESKLKINDWYIEIPYNAEKQEFLGSWGCEVEVKEDKLVLRGEVTNKTIKVLTDTTFGFIVSSVGYKFDVESAVLHTQTREVPNHTKADGSNDAEDMNIGLPYENNRYFPETMSVAEIKAAASALSVAEVKAIIFKEINEHWDVISHYLETDDMLRVFALFLGWASRESTLNAGVETAQEDGFGVNSAHAYGPFQTAVTAFYGCDPTFDQEDDVPELYWYTLTEKNFFDPYISTHMGIRKLIHFIKEAHAFGNTGIDIIRCALKGFNSGHANPMQESEKGTGYSDEIGALSGWYFKTHHFDNNVYTWTGDEKVDRSDPWYWWDHAEPYTNLRVPVRVVSPEDGSTTIISTYGAPTPTAGVAKTTTSDIKPTSNGQCWAKALGYACCTGCTVVSSDDEGKWGVENGDWCGINDAVCNPPKTTTTTTKKTTTTTVAKPTATGNCSAKAFGYPCCKGCTIVSTDGDGNWGVEDGNWCGIDDAQCKTKTSSDTCFAKAAGYPCCTGCTVVSTDADGKWGVENGEWCGIKDSC